MSETYRALCRLRIAYAKSMIAYVQEYNDSITGAMYPDYKGEIFWAKVQGYWEGKLSLLEEKKNG